jgi:hypothetical protein
MRSLSSRVSSGRLGCLGTGTLNVESMMLLQ